jgi:F-type H+-transporting ATPase subunit alpha
VELEAFSRFSTRLDERTRQALERGRRVREILKQPQYAPISVPAQVAVLLALVEGVFDDLPAAASNAAAQAIRRAVAAQLPAVGQRIAEGAPLDAADRGAILRVARQAVADAAQEVPHADA